jgi:dinuclear metal center YbgI/SA1388 family protein
MTKIGDVTNFLEKWAPEFYQEDYDNAGLLVGNKHETIKNILVTLDCTESVINEAIAKNANLVIAHHPIIFKGIKKLNGNNYIEKTIIAAIKKDIAIYASHTNLDHVQSGVNNMIANKLGLINTNILLPKKQTLLKLSVFVPAENAPNVLAALHNAGAGSIGKYSDCAFVSEGKGQFKPGANAKPHIGDVSKKTIVSEQKIEVLLPVHLKNMVLSEMKKAHPYEEVSYFLTTLENDNEEIGAGMVGELENELSNVEFLDKLKATFNLKVIKYTDFPKNKIKKVAVCGGSGSFLLKNAINIAADAFVTSDFKYHEYFDAEAKIMIADIGHFESEQYTKELIHFQLSKKFTNFATLLSETDTNPVKYYI